MKWECVSSWFCVCVVCAGQWLSAVTCSVGVRLHKQSVLAQTSTQEEGCDVMSCRSHGVYDVSGAELHTRDTFTLTLEDAIIFLKDVRNMSVCVCVSYSDGLKSCEIQQSQIIQCLWQSETHNLRKHTSNTSNYYIPLQKSLLKQSLIFYYHLKNWQITRHKVNRVLSRDITVLLNKGEKIIYRTKM